MMGRKGYIRVLEYFTTARVARDLEKIYLRLLVGREEPGIDLS